MYYTYSKSHLAYTVREVAVPLGHLNLSLKTTTGEVPGVPVVGAVTAGIPGLVP